MLIPVFMYHDIKDDDFNLSDASPENRPYIQKISQFRAQLQYLKENGFSALTISDFNRKMKNDFHDKVILITFDDGDQSNYEIAFKLLKDHGLTATFFITTNFIGQSERVTWENLKEMHEGGMEIGSHTVSHPVPSQLTDGEFMFELAESKKILEQGLGNKIQSFSLPTGFYNPKVKKLAKRAGYDCVCTSQTGYLDAKAFDLYHIKRIAVKRITNLSEFSDYAECRTSRLYKKLIKEKLKDSVKGLLGVDLYNSMKNSILERRTK